MPTSFAIGWRQVLACFMLLAATGMVSITYSIVAVPMAAEFHPSRTIVSLAMTLLAIVGGILSPPLGHLMDTVSVRKLTGLGGLLLGFGYAALSLTTSFTQVLLIFTLLIGPAHILIGPLASTVLLSRWFVRHRGRAMGIAIAGIGTGGFFFPMIIQGLFDAHSWRVALQLLGLILLLWTMFAVALVVDRPSDRGCNPDGDAEPAVPVHSEMSKLPISAREVLSDRAFWMIAVTASVVTSGMYGMITNLAPLAIDAGISARHAATLLSIYSGCAVIAKLGFAALADRLGPRVLMFGSLGGFGMGMACLTQAGAGYWVIAAGVGIIGLLGGLMVPLQSYLTPRVFGERVVGRAMGLLSGVSLIALLCTPLLFGRIFDLTGSYTGVFWSFCGLALVTLLLVPAIRLHPRESPAVRPVPAE